jgi:hypothetical protein
MSDDDMNPTNRPVDKYPWPFPRRLQITDHRTGVSQRVEMARNGVTRVVETWDKERGWVPAVDAGMSTFTETKSAGIAGLPE